MADIPYSTDVVAPEADADETAARATLAEAGQQPQLRQSLLRGAVIIALGAVITRLLGLGRETILAGLAGTSAAASAFSLADSTLNTLYDFLVSGMISAALVPVLTQYAPGRGDTRAKRAEFGRIISTLLTGGGVLFVVAVLLLELFAAPLTDFLSAGNPDLRNATIDLLRLIIPSFIFLGLSALLMGAHQSLQRFQFSALPAGARNGSVIIAALLLGSGWFFGTNLGVSSLVVGVLVGSALIVALQLYGLRDMPLRPTFRAADWQHPAIRRILKLYLPIFLGLAVTTTSILIDRHLSSVVGEFSASAMRYATTLQQFALGLIAAAIAQAILPNLSRTAAADDWDAFRRTFALGLRTMAALIFPVTLALLALGLPAVTVVFRHGKFDSGSTWITLVALVCYLPGLPAAAFDQLLIFAFYARKNVIGPVIVGVVADLCLIAIEFALVGPFGLVGLVLANSARQIIHLGIMMVLTRRWQRTENGAGGAALGRAFVNIGLASLLLGVVALLCGGLTLTLFHAWGTGGPQGDSLPANIAALLIGGGAGGAAYLFALWRLGINDLSAMARSILGRLRRR